MEQSDKYKFEQKFVKMPNSNNEVWMFLSHSNNKDYEKVRRAHDMQEGCFIGF